MKRLLLVLSLTVATAADKGWKLPTESPQLEKGPGVELVIGQCMICHSVDYISTQPRLSRAAWTAAVMKMREKYGAPIQTNSVDRLVDYLAKNYGAEKAK